MLVRLVKLVSVLFFIFLFIFFILILSIKQSFNTKKIKKDINGFALEKIKEYKNNYHFNDKEIVFSIDGNIDVKFFPNPRIVVSNFNIKNVQYKNLLIDSNIKEIELGLSYLNFFRKKINPNYVNLNNFIVNITYNKLDNFYYKKEKVKKVVKLDENEVLGIKNKIKDLLVYDSNKNLEDGYKEIDVIEDVKYNIDNTIIESMLIDLINTNNYDISFISNLNFSNSNISIIKDKNIQKEFKSVSGFLKLGKNIHLKSNFILNNILNSFVLDIKEDKDKKHFINVNLNNEIKDKIILSYSGDNIFNNIFDKIKTDVRFSINTQNFNNFIQLLLPSSSRFYYMFDYKKPINLTGNINKNANLYDFNNLNVDSEDIKFNANFNNNGENIDINLNKLNLDNFIVNLSKNDFTNDDSNINIFKYNNFNDFLLTINNDGNNVNKNFNLVIGELFSKGRVLKNSKVNFNVNNGIYKLNVLDLNIDDLKLEIDDTKEFNGLYYNNLTISGKNFRDIASFINLENFINLRDFKLTTKLFINDNVIYLFDYLIKDNEDNKIFNGNVEYSFKRFSNHLALSVNTDKLSFNINNKKSSTLREKFLWLNNITSNVFLDLKVNDLKINDNTMEFDAVIHYYPGYVYFYDIKSLSNINFKNIKGAFLIALTGNRPFIKSNLIADEFRYDGDLISYIIDIEKYKNILLETNINKEIQDKYWVNKLFSFPSFDEISGKFNLNIKNIYLNNSIINDFNFKLDISDGLLNIDSFRFNGLGGSTELKGSLDMKKSKKMDLIFSETVYNMEEIFKLFSKNDNNYLKGNVGISGLIKANGFNPSVFLSSMNLNFKFISNNLFIKKLGLDQLRNDLSNIYIDNDLLKSFKAEDVLLNNTGTRFNNVKGSVLLSSNINNLIVDASSNYISNKLVSKIDNSGKSTIIDIVNTSLITTKVGNTNLPLYTIISFKEDFANKAKLIVNTSQIDEYVDKIRNIKK